MNKFKDALVKLFHSIMDNNSKSSMRVKFFYIATIGGVFGALSATICPLISGAYSEGGIVCCLLTVLFFILLPIIAYKTNQPDRCILAAVIILNFVLYPGLFFTMGGVYCGMPLYFIMGIVFSLLLLTLKQSLIIFPLELLMYAFMFYIADYHSTWIAEIPQFYSTHIKDTAGDFLIVSLTTFCVIKILYSAYEYQLKESERLRAQLEEISITDSMTKVYNRRFLIRCMETEMMKSNRENTPLSLIMFDIDKFKNVNDTHGHLVGDEILKGVSSILKKNCRGYDIVARYGGEEFVVLLPNAAKDTAFERAEQIRKEIETSILYSDKNLSVTVSGGVAQYDVSKHLTVEEFLNTADGYLYEAKENGRNQIIWNGNTRGLI